MVSHIKRHDDLLIFNDKKEKRRNEQMRDRPL